MRIEFTEYTPNDPEYREGEDFQFGGYISVTAESLADTKRIVDYFKIHDGDDPDQLIARDEALCQPDLSYTHRPQKRPYYEVSGCLDVELFQPYKDWATRVFGFTGFPDVSIPFKWAGLRHIYVGIEQQVEMSETVCYTVCTTSEPWNGKTAQEYAEKTVTRYLAEDFGHTEPVREFVRSGNNNNHWVPNPKWGTGFRNPVQPSLANEELCKAFVDWWLENAASDQQKEVIARNKELANQTGPHSLVDWLKDYHGIRVVDPDGDCDYTGKGLMTSTIAFNDFAAMA